MTYQGYGALVSCGNTATCRECSGWANFLHVERCWQGRPAQMIQVSMALVKTALPSLKRVGYGQGLPRSTWEGQITGKNPPFSR